MGPTFFLTPCDAMLGSTRAPASLASLPSHGLAVRSLTAHMPHASMQAHRFAPGLLFNFRRTLKNREASTRARVHSFNTTHVLHVR